MTKKRTETEIDISEAARVMGRKGGKASGKIRTDAKSKASRENGKKGGRPRKKQEN